MVTAAAVDCWEFQVIFEMGLTTQGMTLGSQTIGVKCSKTSFS